jgi:enoyl-CoA hydratase/carnithine racemase
MTTTIKTHRDGAVGVLTLHRPERMNAFTFTMAKEMIDAFHAFDADPDVRAILVQGEGKAFCAGADIEGGFGAGLQSGESPPIENDIARDSGGWLNLEIWDIDTPIIAAIHRAAVGIGFTMLLPMDIIIAAEGTKMAIPFTRRGIAFDGAASYFLPRIVGLATAKSWAITGRTFLAEEAKTAGMIAEIVPDAETAKARAMELAKDIAKNCSPTSIAINKQLMRASIENLSDNYPTASKNLHMQESDALNDLFVSPDCAEGVKSFFEKRAPVFQPYKKPTSN